MKLRITKGRIACAVVLLPVLYVLNIGPVIFCTFRFGLSPIALIALYQRYSGVWLERYLKFREEWWLERVTQDPCGYGVVAILPWPSNKATLTQRSIAQSRKSWCEIRFIKQPSAWSGFRQYTDLKIQPSGVAGSL